MPALPAAFLSLRGWAAAALPAAAGGRCAEPLLPQGRAGMASGDGGRAWLGRAESWHDGHTGHPSLSLLSAALFFLLGAFHLLTPGGGNLLLVRCIHAIKEFLSELICKIF